MRSINILPSHMINQIAAGEVIENPASVVKELVENSIDAGSKKISIEIKGGGLQLICVEDDGCGMSKKDVFLSLKRHATSKIQKLEDLSNLFTMGFRGEALASIASISRLSIQSSANDEGRGHFVRVEGGEIFANEPISRNRGTTVEVKALFYNVPARKKFQKTINVLTGQISRIMHQLALAHPHISFTFISQDNHLLKTNFYENKDFLKILKWRVEEVLKDNFFSSMLEVQHEHGPIKISGYIGEPLSSRRNRSGQYLFINHRPVYCPFLAYAVKDGYGTMINEGTFPVFVLHIDMLPEYLDVNVHPQKKEIRFLEEIFIRKEVQKAIFHALQKNGSENCLEEKFSIDSSFSFSEEKDFFGTKEPVLEYFEEKKQDSFVQPELFSPEEKKTFETTNEQFFLLKKHLLIKTFNETLLVDLSGAYARCLFSLFSSPLQKENMNISRQSLLVPIMLEMSAKEISSIEMYKQSFLHMGFEIRVIGNSTCAIDAIPSFVKTHECQELIEVIVEELSSSGKSVDIVQKNNKKLAQAFCRYSKGRKKIFSYEEAQKLYYQLKSCEDSFYDPLGNPIIVHIKEEDFSCFFSKKKEKL